MGGQVKIKSRANLQEKGWHYEASKKQERKETRKFREKRKNKRRQWEVE